MMREEVKKDPQRPCQSCKRSDTWDLGVYGDIDNELGDLSQMTNLINRL